MIKWITHPLCWVLNWNLDAGPAYKRIPNAYKMHIVCKAHHIIDYRQASFHKKNRILPAYKAYSYKIAGQYKGHNEPLHLLMNNKTLATAMNAHIARKA